MSDELKAIEESEMDQQTQSQEAPKRRSIGFAAMNPERRRELASRGGKAAHAGGSANKFTPETGAAAGRIPHARGTAKRWSREEAAAAGRKGGKASRSTSETSLEKDAS